MNQNEYNPLDIEKKWQDYWQENNTYTAENNVAGKENFYALSEFAYPSGNLHVGHWYAFAVPDIYARYKRMSGYNVLYPMGFDSFGLPAENAAIKRGLDPRKWTYENMDYMRNQLKSMGASFDWSRTLATSDPEYYKWTQWMLKITKFADELHDDLEDLDWDHSIKAAQREWIGRKEGSLIPFTLSNQEIVKVFTTRADTLFGATYVVLAPEHKMVQDLKSQITNWDEVESYLKEVEKKSDLDRQQSKEKTGVQLQGITAINPATKQPVSVWIADYVLAHFGTGAVMAVPAHDERDAEFAIKYNLPFKFVCLPSAGDIGSSRPLITSGENAFILAAGATDKKGTQDCINAEWNAMYDLLGTIPTDGMLPVGKRFCCSFEGKVINSAAEVNTKTSEECKKIITEMVGGEITKTYRLRDWGISRQRYWGTPIPMVYDTEGNAHPVPEEHLPWTLPSDVDFTPDGTAPLARSEELKKRTTEIFGEGWTPEVDTMDTFVDSSWYFYRYLDAQNSEQFASENALSSWMPVDMYFGGAEHTTMHLLYSRFWVKALHSLGLVPANEPYKSRLNRGLILGPDGAKMSKSKGNVIDPDEVVSHVGSDTVRMYLAFIGPFNEPGNYPWDPNGVVGIRRFLDRVWRLQNNINETTDESLVSDLHQTIKKVSEDIDRLKLNTGISAMMTFINKAEKTTGISESDYYLFIQILAPFAPHMCEELWMKKHDSSIHLSVFPKHDDAKISTSMKALPIQINGKVRSEVVVEDGEEKEMLQERILQIPDIQKWVDGKELKKFIHVPGKIINLVVV